MPSGEKIYVVGVDPERFPLKESSPLLWTELMEEEMLGVVEYKLNYLIYFMARPEDVV